MEKTAIQQLIEHFQRIYSVDPVSQTMCNILIKKLEGSLVIERAQIEQAYTAGQTDVFDSKRLHNSSDYFTSKYGDDE